MLEKDRINELIEAVIKVARGDYSAQIELSGKNDELDSLAMGLNMMVDDIRNEITERKKTEERIEHINSILLAIRNVNQLITRERDRDKLLKGACENLIETRGYYNAWIALLDESGRLVTTAEAGLGEDFLPVVEWLKSGKMTTCSQKALKRKEVISIVDPSFTCVDCPLAGKYIDRGAMSIRLEYGRKIYGLLSVSIPRDFVSDEEEKALFDEISGDIAFALYNIEVDEERKKAEEALKRSEDKYRSLTNNINIGIYRSTPGPKGKFLEVNPALVKIFGYKSREKFLALDVVSLYQNPEDRKNFSEKVKKEGFVRNEELRLKRKDGTPIIASAGTVAIKDDKGKVKYYDGIIEDITERKKVEEALQKKTYALGERLKELSCLYGIDEICRREGITIDEVLKEAVRIVPPNWQYPDSTESCITFEGKKYKTRNFKKTKWIQSADIIIGEEKAGLVEVYYLEEKPKSDEGPFLKEERELINAVAERLSQFIGHRQAEVDLKGSEERYKDLVEKAGIAILVDDENGKIIYANQKAGELYGYSLKELKNQSIQSLVHPDDIKKVAQFHNDRLRGKEAPLSYEFKGIKKDGSIIYVELDVVELKEKERAIGTRLYLKDITKRKKAEEELKDSEERLKIIFDYAPDGYYLNDLKGNFIDGNIAATKLVGYKKKELIGKSFLKLKLLSVQEIPKAAAGLARNILGKPTGPDEYILNRKDGKQTAVEIRTYPVKIKDQTIVLGNVRDITERERAKEKIEKSMKEKEVLLKEIHHRVKNNMQIISSLLNIQSANIEDENVREIFNVSQNRIRSMALMHETLYKSEDLARIDFSEYIRRLTTHLMSMYRVGMEPIRPNLDIVDVYLDINRAIPCGMIISELVSNSLKHAFPDGKGGEIAVKMFTGKKKKVTLIVSDTGVGFPEGLDFRETKSMGMQLVTDLTRQIKGTMKIGRDKGTEFKIVF